MTTPAPEMEVKIRAAYALLEPTRMFCGCKVATEEKQVLVRIYSQSDQQKRIMPPPYETLRFDPVTGLLSSASQEEEQRHVILNYK